MDEDIMSWYLSVMIGEEVGVRWNIIYMGKVIQSQQRIDCKKIYIQDSAKKYI